MRDAWWVMRRWSAASLPALLFAGSLGCAGTPAGVAPTHTPPRVTAAGTGSAPTPSPSTELRARVPSELDPAVRTATLPNGLTYFVMKRAEPANRAALWLAVNAGSVLEDDDQRGLAHFVEHMAFNGTTHYPKNAIFDFLQRAGMRLGADVNAATSFDQTVYQLTVPTDHAELLTQGVDVLHEIAHGITFDPAEVEQERPIILEEWRLHRGARARARDEEAPIVFAGSRYADREVIGLTDTIRTAPPAALARFYHDWYRPNLMGVIAVGDFDPDAMERSIRERFGDLENPPEPRVRPEFQVAHAGPPAVAIHVDPELATAEVTLLDRTSHQERETRDDYRRGLVERIFFTALGDRLARLRDTPASVLVKTGVGRRTLSRSLDAFAYTFTPREGKLDNALFLVVSELNRLALHGLSPMEFAQAKKQVEARYEGLLEESDRAPLGQKASELVRHLFENEQTPGDAVELAWLRELVPGVTLDEVQRFAAERARGLGRVLLVDVPSKGVPPTREGLEATLRLASGSDPGPWKGKDGPVVLMETTPAPGKIVLRRHDAGADADVWTLSNGVRVVVKPTTFSHTRVLVRGFQPGGTSLASEHDFLDTAAAPAVVMSSGAGKLNTADLTSLLLDSGAELKLGIGELEQTFEGKSRSDDLLLLFQALYLRLTLPRTEPHTFRVWKEHTLESLRHDTDVPERRFQLETIRASTRDHWRRRPLDAAMVERIDPDDALVQWRRHFGNFRGFTFVVVGHFDPKKLEELVTTYLANLPSSAELPRFKDPHITFETGPVERTVSGEIENKASVWLEFGGPFVYRPGIEADAGILRTILQQRLLEELREKLGGVYTFGVRTEIVREPAARHVLTIQFTCAPENVQRLRSAIFQQLESMTRTAVGDGELEKARAELARQSEAIRKTDAWWLGRLSDAYRYGDDFAAKNDLPALLARATANNVRRTAQLLFDPRHYVLVVMQPNAPKAALPTAAVSPVPLPPASPTAGASPAR